MKPTLKISAEEFEQYQELYRVISDADYGYNKKTGEWDVPSIEWEYDGYRDWERYESEDAREEAVEAHLLHLESFVLKLRNEEEKREAIEFRINKSMDELKTLGGMFPELHALKNSMNQ